MKKSVLLPSQLNDTVSSSSKRSHRDDVGMDTDEECTLSPARAKRACTSPSSAVKENCGQTAVSVDHILNFPLPSKSGKVCHIKIYKNPEYFKLNGLYEFVGFLSLDPLLSHENYHQDEFDNIMEVQTHNPPPSLVPRVHCVDWKKLVHGNPLVETGRFSRERKKYLSGELLVVLTEVLLGDKLAAEYLLYHLISAVYVSTQVHLATACVFFSLGMY